ncbi:hypothetical protein AVEN_201507-1 [Araneus ventricosus]|uniref:Uncharacterized protein n=1 Tax=Araneus ventricosus TaxID=182803 RepID=A0A4Y2UZA4_ARAVE|nr:hypothetical protein AVEN_262063-1 [Araneus ventricosus]GBO16970.1 hypothetical protein AVEN_201507-1 [Araneus ventricosus]
MLMERLPPRWSSTGLTPFLGSPGQCATPTGGRLATMYDLTCNRAPYTADLQWNRVSNLKPSSLKAETLPLVHRDHDTEVGVVTAITGHVTTLPNSSSEWR